MSYLYYKLYQAVLKGSLRDIPRFVTPVFVAGLISVNIIVLNAFLAKVQLLSFFFSQKLAALLLIICSILAAILYYNGPKVDEILKKFSNESKAERQRGNFLVWVYVTISFISIFLVAFFRPGKF